MNEITNTIQDLFSQEDMFSNIPKNIVFIADVTNTTVRVA
jgi:hypothetical protein